MTEMHESAQSNPGDDEANDLSPQEAANLIGVSLQRAHYQLQRRGGVRLPAHPCRARLIPDASAKVRSSRSMSPMGWKATSVTPC